MASTKVVRANDKAPKNIVHDQAILVETIKKELREQKLFTNFTVNPFTKREFITDKPSNYPEELHEQKDDQFLDIIHRANLEPTKKFKNPQTTAQEIGWLTTPFLENNREDRRLHYSHIRTEISKYAEEYYKFHPKVPAPPRAAGGGGGGSLNAPKN